MTEIERVEELRLFFKFNKKTFAEVLGYAYSQNYTSFLNGKSKISMKMIKGLKEYDPRISIDWILTGQGSMLLGSLESKDQTIINNDGSIAQVGDFSNSDNSNNKNIKLNSNTNQIELLKNKIEFLEKALEDKEARLKDKEERLKDKDRIISMLEKNQK